MRVRAEGVWCNAEGLCVHRAGRSAGIDAGKGAGRCWTEADGCRTVMDRYRTRIRPSMRGIGCSGELEMTCLRCGVQAGEVECSWF